MPWYLQFLVSWIEESNHSPVMWVPYERIVRSPAETTEAVAQFCGVECRGDRLSNFIAGKPRVNFNKGIQGRGFDLLDETMHRKLAALAGYHRAYLGSTAMDYLLEGKAPELFASELRTLR
jgi:hypothetical protein